MLPTCIVEEWLQIQLLDISLKQQLGRKICNATQEASAVLRGKWDSFGKVKTESKLQLSPEYELSLVNITSLKEIYAIPKQESKVHNLSR